MNRRLAGVGLLAAVTLSILLTSSLSQRAIPGRASAEPVPSAPQIGDCLIDPPGRDGALLSWSTSLPSVRHAACAGLRYGEIVDVLPAFSPDGIVDDPAISAAYDQCFTSARQHVGVPDETFDAAGPWWPAIQIQSVLIGPDPRQRAAGQAWAACLLYAPPDSSGQPGSLDGSLLDVWQDGRNAGMFAVCLDDIAAVPVGCRDRHRFEIFGTLDQRSDFTEQDLESSCRELVSQATAMPDITAAGALSVRVVPFRYDEKRGLTVSEEQSGNGSAFCLITPSEDRYRLTASLRELGNGLVPIS